MSLAATLDAALAGAIVQAKSNSDPEPRIALPSSEVVEEWATLSTSEREEILENIAAESSQEYGVEVTVTFAGPQGRTPRH